MSFLHSCATRRTSLPIDVPRFRENVWVNSQPSRERETWRPKRQDEHSSPNCLPAQRFLYARSFRITAPASPPAPW